MYANYLPSTRTEDQKADLLTKPLADDLFFKLITHRDTFGINDSCVSLWVLFYPFISL